MEIEEWHAFLSRYRTSSAADEEHAEWLEEFEKEHGAQARREYEEN